MKMVQLIYNYGDIMKPKILGLEYDRLTQKFVNKNFSESERFNYNIEKQEYYNRCCITSKTISGFKKKINEGCDCKIR